MKNLIRVYKKLSIQFHKNHISEYAASSAYYTILSFIPLILLILTLTKYVGLEQESVYLLLHDLIPNHVNVAVMEIVKEIDAKSFGTITVSLLFTLWSAGRGFLALCKGLSAAYDVKENKSWMQFRIKAILSTIIFIVSIVFSLLLLVFSNGIYIALQEKTHYLSDMMRVFVKSKEIFGFFILTIIFTVMYRWIPKHTYSICYQIPGAMVASIACMGISFFYSMYIDIFTGFSIMYGSLTSVVLAMMWIYGCAYSILVGACLNHIFCKSM